MMTIRALISNGDDLSVFAFTAALSLPSHPELKGFLLFTEVGTWARAGRLKLLLSVLVVLAPALADLELAFSTGGANLAVRVSVLCFFLDETAFRPFGFLTLLLLVLLEAAATLLLFTGGIAVLLPLPFPLFIKSKVVGSDLVRRAAWPLSPVGGDAKTTGDCSTTGAMDSNTALALEVVGVRC
jgi:hypothetical protein